MKKSFLQFVRKTKTQPLRPIVPWIHEKNRKAIRFATFWEEADLRCLLELLLIRGGFLRSRLGFYSADMSMLSSGL